MRTDRGVVGLAVLWLLMAVSALGLAGLRIARWQRSRSVSQLAEVQSRLLVAASAMLAHETQFQFLEKTDRFESGSVQLTRVADAVSGIVLRCTATVGHFDKRVDVGWKKTSTEWAIDYWAEP